jgi:hypothetical protein
MMTDEEYMQFHDDRYNELPQTIKYKAIETLKSNINNIGRNQIRMVIKADRINWGSPHHFSWGMGIRNLLRKNVCLDGDLPSGNWDDYYIRLVEKAVEKE